MNKFDLIGKTSDIYYNNENNSSNNCNKIKK